MLSGGKRLRRRDQGRTLANWGGFDPRHWVVGKIYKT